MTSTRRIILLSLIFFLFLPIAYAQNDPGHDVLYIKRNGDNITTFGVFNFSNAPFYVRTPQTGPEAATKAYVDSMSGSGLTGSGSANRTVIWLNATSMSYDNNFSWDNSNKRLAINETSPAQNFVVRGTANITAAVYVPNTACTAAQVLTTGASSILACTSWADTNDTNLWNANIQDINNLNSLSTNLTNLNASKAGVANCPAGQVVMNTTNSGIQCIAAGAGTVTGSGATNNISIWTSGTAIGSSPIYLNGANLGVGTPSAGAAFEVNGSGIIGSSASTRVGINYLAAARINSISPQTNDDLILDAKGTGSIYVNYDYGGGGLKIFNGSTAYQQAQIGGSTGTWFNTSVGINSTSPRVTLDVAGGLYITGPWQNLVTGAGAGQGLFLRSTSNGVNSITSSTSYDFVNSKWLNYSLDALGYTVGTHGGSFILTTGNQSAITLDVLQGNITVEQAGASINAPIICLAGNCQSSWPSGGGIGTLWVNGTNATYLFVNNASQATLNVNLSGFDTRYFRADTANSVNARMAATNGLGLRFWDTDTYKIYMSATSDGTWGGRLDSGASDYNMYFTMGGGTNRGWVFASPALTPVAQIDASGNIYSKGVPYFNGTTAGYFLGNLTIAGQPSANVAGFNVQIDNATIVNSGGSGAQSRLSYETMRIAREGNASVLTMERRGQMVGYLAVAGSPDGENYGLSGTILGVESGDIIFKTGSTFSGEGPVKSGTLRMIIKNAGSVGVGVQPGTSAAQSLHVNGSLAIGTFAGSTTPGLIFNYMDAGTSTVDEYQGRYGAYWYKSRGSATGNHNVTVTAGTDTQNFFGIVDPINNANIILFNTNATSYINNGQKFGINMSNPSATLDVTGSFATTRTASLDTGGSGGISVGFSMLRSFDAGSGSEVLGVNTQTGGVNAELQINALAGGTPRLILQGSGATKSEIRTNGSASSLNISSPWVAIGAPTSAFFVNGTYVGIGTASPNENLQVHSAGSTFINVSSSGTGSPSGWFAAVGGTPPEVDIGTNYPFLIKQNGFNNIYAYNGGVVGINMSSATDYPPATLTVKGTIMLNSTGTKPTCTAAYRGEMFYESSASGTDDFLYTCMKNSTQGYNWVMVARGG